MPLNIDSVPRRVVVVDDSAHSRTLTAGAVESMGFSVETAGNAEQAFTAIEEHDPDLLIVDLDLGPGPNGIDIIREALREAPWLAVLVVTAFRSPALVDPDTTGLERVAYLVKSELTSLDILRERIEEALGARPPSEVLLSPGITITKGQAQLLRLIAIGYSNSEIAKELSITPRSVEHATRRLYRALGLSVDDGRNPRVAAARMYRQAPLDVRARAPRP